MGLMSVTVVLVGINLLLILYLGWIHLKTAARIPSSISIGLLAFLSIFLLENALALYYYLTMMGLYVNGTEIPIFVLKLLETIAFAIYIWVIHR